MLVLHHHVAAACMSCRAESLCCRLAAPAGGVSAALDQALDEALHTCASAMRMRAGIAAPSAFSVAACLAGGIGHGTCPYRPSLLAPSQVLLQAK